MTSSASLRVAAVVALLATGGAVAIVPSSPTDPIPCELTGDCEEWAVRHDTPGQLDFGQAVAFGPDGDRVYATGQINDGANDDPLVVAYDAATGDVAWSARRDTAALHDEGNGLAVAPDAVVVSEWAPKDRDAIAALDPADGTTRWRQLRDLNQAALALSPSGRVAYLAGTFSNGTGAGIRVHAFEVRSGQEIGQATFFRADPDPDDDVRFLYAFPQIQAGPDRVYVTARDGQAPADDPDGGPADGASDPPIHPPDFDPEVTYDLATVALDPRRGAVDWVRHHRPPGTDAPEGIAVEADDGRVFVKARSQAGDSDLDYRTIGYDAATGDVLWNATFEGPTDVGDAGSSVGDPVAVHDDRVYVTGGSRAATRDLTTVAYDAADGTRLWTARAPVGGLAIGSAVDVGPDGDRVHASGWALRETSYDMFTVAHDTETGAVEQRLRYDSADHGVDQPFGQAVGPDGDRIALTGPSLTRAGPCIRDLCDTAMATVAFPVDR